MESLASAEISSSSISSSWPRMQLGQKNPFQNAPGPFIYALPNLAGTCPFSCSPDTDLFCTSSGAGDSDASLTPDPYHHLHNRRCSYCHRDSQSSSESAESSIASIKDGSAPDTESSLPVPSRPSSSSLSPSSESHFDLDDAISSPSPIEDGAEPEQHQHQHQREPQASETSTPPSTPTHSNALSSPAESEFQEGQKKEGEGGEEVKEKKGGGHRKKRRRNRKQGRGRPPLEYGVSTIAPRFMGLSGMHYSLWSQYVCPQAPLPPPPPAMNYHHHGGGFVVPPNSSAPLFWNPMVPATSFVGVPVTSC